MSGKACGTCGNCLALGYDPRKSIMTISYWCKPRNRHTSPDKTCDQWTLGDPWENAKSEWGKRE